MAKSPQPRARTIPKPTSSAHPDPVDRRAAQRAGTPDELGAGITRDKNGRTALFVNPQGALEVGPGGADVRLSEAFELDPRRRIKLRAQGTWRPQDLPEISGSGADDDINAALAELRAENLVLANALRALGVLV